MSFVATIQANIDDFSRNLDRARAQMDAFADNIGKKVASIGSKMQSIGGAISIGITAPLTAAGVAAYNFAADFEDAMGATDQIFKQASESTKEWANSLPTYYGIAEKEALEYSNMMGSMLKNIGKLTDDEASKQSAKLIELAGDLTAMYGGTTQDAVRALTGALKGNNTMLDNYGMAANDALVKAKALSMGLVEQGKEMSLSAKQAATLALIYEQSGAAQGQAAREAEGASGSMRAFRTEITNLTTELGNVLLPIITPIVSKLRDMAAGFRDLSPETKKYIVIIGAAVAALGPLLVGLGAILQIAPLVGAAFTFMTGPIGIAVAAIAAAAILIVKNWDRIVAYFTKGDGAEFWSSIIENAQYLWSKLKEGFDFIKDSIIHTWKQIDTNVISIVRNSFSTILSIVKNVFDTISGAVKTFNALMRGDFSGALEHVKTLFKNVFYNILDVAKNTLSTVGNLLAVVLKSVGADGLADSLTVFSNSLKPVVGEVKSLTDVINRFNQSNSEYAKIADEAIARTKAEADAVKGLSESTEGAKKETRNYKNELIDLFAGFGYYDSQMQSITNKFNGFRDMATKAGASAKEFARIAREELGEKLNTALNQFSLTGASSGISGLSAGLTIPISLKVDEKATQFTISKLTEDARTAAEKIDQEFKMILESGIENTLGDFAAAIGSSLADGGNIIQSAGSALLGGLGSILVQLGKMAISTGVGLEAVKTALSTLQGPVAIAAGAALIAIGSAFSAGAKSLGKSAGGGGYTSSSGSAVSATQYSQPLLQGAYSSNSQVVFEISGDKLRGVLDRYDNKNNRSGGRR